MSQHYFSLQKYAGTRTRHTCPRCGGKRCFTLYVDETGMPLDSSVGRCDHESACGYHYTPKDYFRDHPNDGMDTKLRWSSPPPAPMPKPTPLCTIPMKYVERSMNPNMDSQLIQYLRGIIDADSLKRVIEDYRIGVTRQRDIIYFQIDIMGRCRTGKVMKYNPEDGHRIKDESVSGKINWVHSILKQRDVLDKDWVLTQCLFGEHLLPKYRDRKVALVESEKTALICAALMPDYVWVATGGKTQLGDKLKVLKGREVVAFPDVDGYDEWVSRLSCIGGLSIHVSDYLQKNATEQDRDAHVDIADILIRGKSMNTAKKPSGTAFPILEYFDPKYHETLQLLIDTFDLIPISIVHNQK